MHSTSTFTPAPHILEHELFDWTIYGAGIAALLALTILTIVHVARADKDRNIFAELGRDIISGAVVLAALIGLVSAISAPLIRFEGWANDTISYLHTEYRIDITTGDANSLARGRTIPAVQDGKTITLRLSADGTHLAHADGTPLESWHHVR